MESILFWILGISAITIVLMLALLLAALREVKRLRAQVARSAATPAITPARGGVHGHTDRTNDKNPDPANELAILKEQLESGRAKIERMRGEIQALRAESNSRIKQSAYSQGEFSQAAGAGMPGRRNKSPEAMGARIYIDKRAYMSRRTYLPAVIVVSVAVAAALYYVEIRANKVEVPQPAVQPVEPAVKADEPPESEKPADLVVDRPAIEQIVRRADTPANTAPVNSTPYQVVRSTRVFSKPDDRSEPLARIDAGMEVNVVGVRDDWLEVRSRHGRPSGFIKSDAAVTTGKK